MLVPVVSLAVQSALARPPATLGVVDGRLAACPQSPNAVSSQTDSSEHYLEPLTFTDEPAEAWQRLKRALAALPRTVVVTETEGYLHAEATSRLFRFVDDVEFLLDKRAKQIEFRSASRVGHSDLGVNRVRIESLRRAFETR
ncbi:MAG: DUF1499 domain-containing protein [Planctomycetaceae bacterium]|nr:MAG: DUF1499 domain-containing protein [Planctomycetaceae bacterium]